MYCTEYVVGKYDFIIHLTPDRTKKKAHTKKLYKNKKQNKPTKGSKTSRNVCLFKYATKFFPTPIDRKALFLGFAGFGRKHFWRFYPGVVEGYLGTT